MTYKFAQTTKVHECSNWEQICNRFDILVKDAHIDKWKNLVAGFMKTNYSPAHSKRLKTNLLNGNTRFGLSLGSIIQRVIPTREKTQKADLAEAVCCLSFEELFEITVPYYRWANKSHIEMPEHGIDVLAFQFQDDPSKDILYLTEVKWRDNTTSLLNILKRSEVGVIPKMLKLTDLEICDQINLLLKRIENDSIKKRLYSRILDFFDRFVKHPKPICNTTFFLVDSRVDLDKCIKALSPLTRLPRQLRSYNHLMDDLKVVTADVFGVIKA
jgi:hypothetical protein